MILKNIHQKCYKNNFSYKAFPHTKEQIFRGHTFYKCITLRCSALCRNPSLTSSLHMKLFHLQVWAEHMDNHSQTFCEDVMHAKRGQRGEHRRIPHTITRSKGRHSEEGARTLPAANCSCPFHIVSVISPYFFPFLCSCPYILAPSFRTRVF